MAKSELAVTPGAIVPQGEDTMDVIGRELARDPALASPHTRRTYAGALRQFEEWRGHRPVTKLLVEEYAAHLQAEGQAHTTINHKLSAIRWWAGRLADLATESTDMDPERRAEIVRQAERATEAEGVKGRREPKGRHVPLGEVRALLEACERDDGNIGTRDGAMIALAHAVGLRRAELVGLDLADVRQTENGETELRIMGKGRKERKVTINEGAEAWLSAWLAVRGDGPGALFLAVLKSGEVTDSRIGPQAAQERLAKRAEQAGVAHLTWHDFRRSLGGDLLDDGADLVTVQHILGHESPVTTSGYDRRGDATRRKALRRRHTPRPGGA